VQQKLFEFVLLWLFRVSEKTAKKLLIYWAVSSGKWHWDRSLLHV